MKRLFFIMTLLNLAVADATHAQGDLEIWREFVGTLKQGELPKEKIRPYHESLSEPLLGFLRQMREKAAWEEWEANPEIFRVNQQAHFLISLSFDNQRGSYCFSFIIEGKAWYFQHLEFITIRLDQISSLPASAFPDLPEEKKMWIREEFRVSHLVRLFNLLAQEKGREFAFNWLKDGAGYALAARAWVPFFPSAKAFILYLCWEQSNLLGNKVTLEKLNDDQATVSMRPLYFDLYKATAHLKQQISFEEYRHLFETIWHDRAMSAGWELTIAYEGEEVVFNFKKKR